MSDTHSFSVEYAKRYGVPCAVAIQSFQYWIKHNAANGKNEREGKWWTFNSARALAALFPYWTDNQVRTVIKHLLDDKVLIVGNFNKHGYDQTLWYAFEDEQEFLGEFAHGPISTNAEMEIERFKNAFRKSEKPIPVSSPVPDSDPLSSLSVEGDDTPPLTHPKTNGRSYEAQFEELWKGYPRKSSKKAAYKSFKARIREGVPIAELRIAVENYAETRRGQDQQYTLMGSTFFGPNERWRDYLKSTAAGAEEPARKHKTPGQKNAEDIARELEIVNGISG